MTEPAPSSPPLRYLSLFSGIGGFELGIRAVFPNAVCLGYSEISEPALQVYRQHFPGHEALGDVREVDFTRFLGQVDLVVGGSPCQDVSTMRTRYRRAGVNGAVEGKRSSLFREFVRCLEQCRPRYFVLENVGSMSKAARATISEGLGVQPVPLNSQDFSAQRRRRLFWSNFPIPQPPAGSAEEAPSLQSILMPMDEVKDLKVSEKMREYMYKVTGPRQIPRWKAYGEWHDTIKSKSMTICHNKSRVLDRRFQPEPIVRYMHVNEAEALQTFPHDYTDELSTTNRFAVLGNAVTVRVVEYIMSALRGTMAGVAQAELSGALPPPPSPPPPPPPGGPSEATCALCGCASHRELYAAPPEREQPQ